MEEGRHAMSVQVSCTSGDYLSVIFMHITVAMCLSIVLNTTGVYGAAGASLDIVTSVTRNH